MKERELIESRSLPEPNTGCWIWLRSRSDTGYGSVHFRSKTTGAPCLLDGLHRPGPIPDGAQVMHRCDNRWCVNPQHLSLGSFKDNMDDRNKKGRVAHGLRAAAAKLDPERIEAARRLRTEGESYERIAIKFGVVRHTISNALRGVTWKRVVSK